MTTFSMKARDIYWRDPEIKADYENLDESDSSLDSLITKSISALNTMQTFFSFTYFDNLNYINEIKNYGTNWDGYGSKPIPSAIVETVRRVIMSTPFQLKIMPTGRQSIMMAFSFGNENQYLIEVFNDHFSYLKTPYPGKKVTKTDFVGKRCDVVNATTIVGIINEFASMGQIN